MARVEREVFAKRVFHYDENIANHDTLRTIKHFVEEGHHRCSIYKIINRCQGRGSAEFQPIPGRPAVATSPSKVKKVEKVFKKNPSISVPMAARKLNMKRNNVSDMKVHKLGITARTKQKAPKYIKDQENRAKTGCRKIYKKTREKILVIDDESYVILDPLEQPGRKFVHAANHKELEYDQRFKHVTKFPEKFLIWQAMDEFGNVSDPYITKGTINKEIYLEECLKKRLFPFIHRYHDVKEVLFWPDLATSHYANKCIDFLKEKVDFVLKKENPPNVPQARGIEEFWSICKERYSHRPVKPKSERSFKYLWGQISREVGRDVGKKVMDDAHRKLQQIGYKGIRRAMCDISNKH